MKHYASSEFWRLYNKLPNQLRQISDKNFQLLKSDPTHPSLHFKKINKYRSARIGLNYRVLGIDVNDGILWFWIGNHTDYDKYISKL